jgi:lambda repressor-like predicted transcriptional regulator
MMEFDPYKLQAAIRDRGLTHAMFSRKSGVSEPVIRYALAGKPVQIRHAVAIAQALDRIPIIFTLAGLAAPIKRNPAALRKVPNISEAADPSKPATSMSRESSDVADLD